MIEDLLEQLRSKVEKASGLPDTTKTELLKLVAEVKGQTADGKHPGAADGQHGIHRLISSVEDLEVSHPDITDLVNRIATMLGNIGI
jgi:hypothetical protein